MSDLAPGPEMDAAVARAVDLAGMSMLAVGGGNDFYLLASIGYRRWSPSTDLNAAFEAAEKAGLFDPSVGFLCKGRVNEWCYLTNAGVPATAWGATTAEAICRAILALKGDHA